MVFMTNPFVLPLLVLIWSADAWLWLALLRLILTRFKPQSTFGTIVSQITDPLPRLATLWINRWFNIMLSTRASWLVMVVAVIFLRYVLMWFVMSVQTS